MTDALWFDPTEMLIGGTWRGADETLTLVDPSYGTDLAQIEPDAHEVEPELSLVVRCLPTEHAA